MSDDPEPQAAKPKSKAKLLVFAAVGVILLLGGGIGGAFALGLLGGSDGATTAADDHGAAGGHGNDSHDTDDHGDGHGADHGHAAAEAHHGDAHGGGHVAGAPLFVDLPQMLVNLVVTQGRPRFLKLSLAVEVTDAGTAERIQSLAPRIVDSFQLYLRTLTPAELQGAGSMFRLKEDLHVRIHQAIEPDRVRNVLFKEMLVQ